MHAPSLPEPADFLADTAVEPAGAGLYRIDLSDRWNAALFPFGGVVSAIALRAMQAELGERGQRLRSTTSVYVTPVPTGPLEVRVSTLRHGRRMSQLLANVRAAGGADGGLTVLAAYGEDREGFEFQDGAPPEAPAPEDTPLPGDPPPEYGRFRSTFFEQMDFRPVRMNPPWRTDWQAGAAEAVRWMRFRRPPRLADGTLDPLALVALSDTMPPAIGQALGPGGSPWFAPSVDLTTHVLESTREEWVLIRSRCRHASGGYATADNELWSRDGRLLVYAAQIMYFRLGALDG
jgi:acyl-CoA thioesterase